MDNLTPIRPFMVIPGTGEPMRVASMPMEPVALRCVTVATFVQLPHCPVNDDQPTPPRAA